MKSKLNITDCGIRFEALKVNDSTLFHKYSYTGPVHGILAFHRPDLISYQGCREFCGHGTQYYAWQDASATISTWVLPVIGMILQAPFESNDSWDTFSSLCRWVGSPIASLSYVLWNIKVTSKCALMIDMSVGYEESPNEGSDFSKVRDSLYILSVMNQFKMRPNMPSSDAENLLRIALFSDQLKLSSEANAETLERMRQKLAKYLRESRRRGIVPVYISLMWFLFSLAISIQAAFGELGSNATAHNLAIGLLLCWMPVLILCSIVDRNPIATDQVRRKFNHLIESTRQALLDDTLRQEYLRDLGRAPEEFAWIENLDDSDHFDREFFVGFAGQGRIRCHYGVAHPILSGIEESFVAEHGRDWLSRPGARDNLVRGAEHPQSLHSFDFRELWQISSSVVIVGGTSFGAFVISYFTPTVGLGCRSGGYLIFVIVALASFMLEMFTWWLFNYSGRPRKYIEKPWKAFEKKLCWVLSKAKLRSRPGNSISNQHGGRRGGILGRVHTFKRVNTQFSKNSFNIIPDHLRYRWMKMNTRDRVQFCVLLPLEFGNFVWLVYITLAQTFGWYETCACMASIWGRLGGYIDFQSWDYYRAHGVSVYWGIGTATSCTIMMIGLAFIVIEWCTQSHMSSENYEKAMRGLHRTRRWKKYTIWCRNIPDQVIRMVKQLYFWIQGKNPKRTRRSLVWTCEPTHRLPMILEEEQDNSEDQVLLPGNSGSDIALPHLTPPAPTRSPRLSLGSIDRAISPELFISSSP